jgi:hypothetical protein
VINYCVYLQILVEKLVIHRGVIKQQHMVPYVAVEHDMLLFFLSVSVFSFEFLLLLLVGF